MTSGEKIVFPRTITPIVGQPTNSSLQRLQQELFQNAFSIPCELGGGQLGHLALIMTEAAYLAEPTAAEFVVPLSPGSLAAAPPNATAFAIADLKRIHDNQHSLFTTYTAVRTALLNQITDAVGPMYIAALAHDNFGFARVEPRTMLAHLVTTYGTMTGQEIESNRKSLSNAWDPTTPIESLWAHIRDIRSVATRANQPISDDATIALVLPVFKNTGLFLHSLNAWSLIPRDQQTYASFTAHFNLANEARKADMTTADLKFADANLASLTIDNNSNKSSTNSTNNSGLYYCWSHGLSTNANHTSQNCRQMKSGHIAHATLHKRHGGNNTFRTKEDLVPRNNPKNSTRTAPNDN